MRNPFVYSRPVSPDELIDRESEAQQLLELAEGGHATRLSAPRRYGKTSLLYRVMRDAEAIGLACVYVDFSRAVSVTDVAVTIEEAYRRSLQGPIRRAAVALMRTFSLRARVAPGGVGVEVESQVGADAARQLGNLLDLPLGLHERTGRRTLVIFDEFQELLGAGDRLDGLLRSRIQHHGEAASYIYAGSHPGLMHELFARRERPLFGQAHAMHLDPLADPDLADYIGGRFEQTNRDVGRALDGILDFVGGHPQRAMLLAHHLWAATPRGGAADAEELSRAIDAVRAEARDALETAWSGLERSQRAVLAALATGDVSLLSRRTLERFDLAKTTARDARRRLVEEGFLYEVADRAIVADPFLADFASHRTRAFEEVE